MNDPKALIQRVLLVNDDGIDARGLALLERIVSRVSDEVWVVAPDEERSGASQAISLSVPIRAHELGSRRFAIKGTPADCVMLAVTTLMKDSPPTLVLSGINHGENLGDDMSYSGTSSAAMEATQFGLPAIAFSQVRQLGQLPNFDVAESHLESVLRSLLTIDWVDGLAVNVNFPAVVGGKVSGVQVVPAGRRPRRAFTPVEGRDGRNIPYYWVQVDYARELAAPTGTDLAVVRQNAISITALRRDPTFVAVNEQLKGVFQP